jgi:nitrate/nitrite-specific signal transduction histidine kinase
VTVPGAKGRLGAAMTGGDLVDELRATLDRAGELVRTLEGNLAPTAGGSGDHGDLERRLEAAETDVKELASRLVDSEHQAGRLMNLYVATYQLHSTLDPTEVQETIAEISINLLGAERFALLLREDEGEGLACEIALAEGMEDDSDDFYRDAHYRGGDSLVDATLDDGVLRLGPTADSETLAAVPLRVQEVIVGALVVRKLFDHKPSLKAEDRDLLELLSAHAASALFAARLFAAKDRKLRTLESLVELARGQ